MKFEKMGFEEFGVVECPVDSCESQGSVCCPLHDGL
jgi:hypothetical protein